MGKKIAVLCEDARYDRYIVKPVIERILRSCNSSARFWFIDSPKLRGDGQVIKQACAVMTRYRKQADVVLFVLDLDCEDGMEGRPDKPRRLKNAIESCGEVVDPDSAVLVFAKQELEVWALWGVRADLGESWVEVRAERDPKERFFEHVLAQYATKSVDGGRTQLMSESLSGGLRSLEHGCDEIVSLRQELCSKLG